jgi:HTH-type transcriptional regulator / antitoxin PezA
MDTISERIRAVWKASDLTKTAFAKRIGVGQPYVSDLCSGVKQPSDRTIRDICVAFNVNETWLHTGEGDMFNEVTRDEQITQFVEEVLRERDDSFKRRFVSALSQLDVAGWAALEQFMQNTIAEREKKAEPPSTQSHLSTDQGSDKK